MPARTQPALAHLEQIAAECGDGGMDHKEWKSAREKARAQQADLEAQMAHVDRGPILADLVTADDLRGKWEGLGLHRQRAGSGNDLRRKDLERALPKILEPHSSV